MSNSGHVHFRLFLWNMWITDFFMLRGGRQPKSRRSWQASHQGAQGTDGRQPESRRSQQASRQGAHCRQFESWPWSYPDRQLNMFVFNLNWTSVVSGTQRVNLIWKLFQDYSDVISKSSEINLEQFFKLTTGMRLIYFAKMKSSLLD